MTRGARGVSSALQANARAGLSRRRPSGSFSYVACVRT
ncbi:hypothetical protein BSLA_02f0765 [Burkholderia stabilis]|nr:hypothetical protein BSLA_02f0765 [Burkholderia stabilis]